MAKGFIALKTGVGGPRPARIIETPGFVEQVVERFAAMREAVGNEVDIAIDFHGAVSPQTAGLLIKALEPYQPMFIEEPVQCQNVDVLADLARKTHICPSPPASASSPSGASARSWRSAPPPSCSPTSPTAAASSRRASSPAWPKPTTPPSRRTARWARSRWPPASRSTPRFPTSWPRSTPRWAKAISKQPFAFKDGYLELPTGPGLGIELDEEAMADKIGHDWRNHESYHPDDGAAIDW